MTNGQTQTIVISGTRSGWSQELVVYPRTQYWAWSCSTALLTIRNLEGTTSLGEWLEHPSVTADREGPNRLEKWANGDLLQFSEGKR